jgi:GTPase SAR1 family protein
VIITIRGTHGSGKTTVVRRFINSFPEERRRRVLVPGRKRPLSVVVTNEAGVQTLIPGHYDEDSPSGGCDTITGSAEMIYGIIEDALDEGMNVLYEGIVAQHNTTRLIEVCEDYPADIIALSTPIEACVEAVLDRRRARGADVDNFDPKNVIREHKTVESSLRRLVNHGIEVLRLGREEALTFCLERFG